MNTDYLRWLLNEHNERILLEGAEDFDSKYTIHNPKLVGSRKIIPMEEFVAIAVAKILKDKFFNGPASPKFKNATLNYVLSVLEEKEEFPKITPTVKELAEKVIKFISEKYPFSSIKKDGWITVEAKTFNSQVEILINGRMNSSSIIPGIGPVMIQNGWIPKQTKAQEHENKEQLDDQTLSTMGKGADVKPALDKDKDDSKKLSKEQMENLRRLLYSKEMAKFFMGKKGQKIAFIGSFTNAVVKDKDGASYILLFGKSSSTGKKFSFYVPLADKKAIPSWVERILELNLAGEKKTARFRDPTKEYSISAFVDKLYVSHSGDAEEGSGVDFENMKKLTGEGLVNHRTAISGLHLVGSQIR